MAATIADVAERAKVSPSTVSYVLTGKRPISAPTRARVQAAIKALDYRPHAGARALASARTGIIGLVAPLRTGVDVNVIMLFVAGVVTAAGARSYDVLLLTQDDDTLMRVSRSSMVDALIVMDIEEEDPRIPVLARLDQPTVLIGLPRQTHGLSCVDLDFTRAGGAAAHHLIDAGHRHIALFGAPVEVRDRHTSYAERLAEGFVEAARSAGVEHVELPAGNTAQEAREAVDTLLATHPGVTGIVVHNETAMPHIIQRLAERDHAVGETMSLVAICPENVALAQSVPVTSVDIPGEQIGRTAVEMLISAVERTAPTQVRLISPTVTDRGSTLSVG